MNFSTPGLPVHHQLPEFTQTHVHWVSDAIQPSHPLSSSSPPALYLSQHQGLFKWVSSLHQVAKVLEFQLQHQSFQWTPRTYLLYNGLLDLLAVQRTLKSLVCAAKSQTQLSNWTELKGKERRISFFFLSSERKWGEMLKVKTRRRKRKEGETP